MNTFAMICMSAVLPYTLTVGETTQHGSIVFQRPPHCAAGMLPEVKAPPVLRYEYPAEPRQRALAATQEAPKAKAKKAVKPCKKPGRTRNSRGVCGRWKR